MNIVHLSVASLALAGLVACASDQTEPSAMLAAVARSQGPHHEQTDLLPLYGLNRALGKPCQRAPFKGFDFWVGAWNVYDPASGGSLGGTNLVTEELGGCAIEEHWTDLNGNKGRSLNTYDVGSNTWQQLWMDQGGLALIIEGKASPGKMVMTGDTPKGIGGPIITNRLTWTRDNHNRVQQLWEVSEDGRATWMTVFLGDYERQRQILPADEVVNNFCTSAARVRFHWFDFLVGQWDVHHGPASGPTLGVMTVAKEVSDCLLESTFVGGGYHGKAFAALHFPTVSWRRTWIDEDGVRISLVGQLAGSSMVFTGQRFHADGTAEELRATWTPTTPGQVDELWESSADGGATWTVARQFTLIARTN